VIGAVEVIVISVIKYDRFKESDIVIYFRDFGNGDL
jgi:hypothetical protein